MTMRGTTFLSTRTALPLLLVAGVATGTPAIAQGAGGWSLPDPAASQAPRAQGPVDSQNPVVRPSASAPTPVPTITPPPPRATTPSAPPVRTTPAPAPSPSARPAPRPSASSPSANPSIAANPEPTPAPTPTATTPAATETPTTAPTPRPSSPPPAAVTPDAPEPPVAESWPFWWWAIPVALLVALGALLTLRARRSRPDEPEPTLREPPARPSAPVPPPAAPVTPPPPPIIAPEAHDAIEIGFEPVGLRLSLVYATLQYRLTLTAREAVPAGHLLGDMIGAHASLSAEQQLAPSPETLAPLKPVPALEPGIPATLTGEIQLPLAAIRPLQRGNAALFVPLVRLCLLAGAEPVRRVYTVGTAGGDALGPLRLDAGPAEHRDLAAREVEAARAYPVQGAPQAAAG